MGDVLQHRITTGLFLNCLRGNMKLLASDYYFWSFIFLNFIFHQFVIQQVINMCVDIESNPGPEYADNKITIANLNVRSLTAQGCHSEITKFDEIKAFVLLHGFAVFTVTETWLDNRIQNDSILIPGYLAPCRRDRNRHGGGLCNYVY